MESADVEKPVAGPVEVDMRYYNSLMGCVPLESTSVALMMHCMLGQVCSTYCNITNHHHHHHRRRRRRRHHHHHHINFKVA